MVFKNDEGLIRESLWELSCAPNLFHRKSALRLHKSLLKSLNSFFTSFLVLNKRRLSLTNVKDFVEAVLVFR